MVFFFAMAIFRPARGVSDLLVVLFFLNFQAKEQWVNEHENKLH